MKAQVVFDKTGKVIGMYHLINKSTSKNEPVVSLKPQAGEHVATLDIPAELQHLSPGAIHAAVYVELRGGSEQPRLVSKAKH